MHSNFVVTHHYHAPAVTSHRHTPIFIHNYTGVDDVDDVDCIDDIFYFIYDDNMNNNDMNNNDTDNNIVLSDNEFDSLKICCDPCNNSLCYICYEKYTKTCTILTTQCGHEFHHDCSKEWFTNKSIQWLICQTCQKFEN